MRGRRVFDFVVPSAVKSSRPRTVSALLPEALILPSSPIVSSAPLAKLRDQPSSRLLRRLSVSSIPAAETTAITLSTSMLEPFLLPLRVNQLRKLNAAVALFRTAMRKAVLECEPCHSGASVSMFAKRGASTITLCSLSSGHLDLPMAKYIEIQRDPDKIIHAYDIAT